MTLTLATQPATAAFLASADGDAIRDLRVRFSDAANRHDYDAFAGLFAVDGVWDLPDMQAHFRGREAIRSGVEPMTDVWSDVVQRALDGPIAPAPVGAVGLTYVEECGAAGDAGPPAVHALYDDVYVREEGRWRFMRRTYHVLSADAPRTRH